MKKDKWVRLEIWTYPNTNEEGTVIQGTASVSCLIFITENKTGALPALKTKCVAPDLTRLPGVRSDPSNDGLCLVEGEIDPRDLEVAILNLIETDGYHDLTFQDSKDFDMASARCRIATYLAKMPKKSSE